MCYLLDDSLQMGEFHPERIRIKLDKFIKSSDWKKIIKKKISQENMTSILEKLYLEILSFFFQNRNFLSFKMLSISCAFR